MTVIPRIEVAAADKLVLAPSDDNTNPIPSWTQPDPPDDSVVRNYVLSVSPNAASRTIDIYFSVRPEQPDPSNDNPREMRVPEPCQLVIDLDPMWDWEFRHTDAVRMKAGATNSYFNLEHVIDPVTGRCTRIRMHAERFDDPAYANIDEFSIYVILSQGTGAPVPTSLDPDIKNPGDDPP
ncbi:MAG: nucleotide synthetase [Rhizomicrobium sp.]